MRQLIAASRLVPDAFAGGAALSVAVVVRLVVEHKDGALRCTSSGRDEA